MGWIELNFDSSYNHFKGKGRVGGIIRDHNGKLLVGYAGEVQVQRPLAAELLALQRGLVRCQEQQLSAVLIEGDCLVVISSIQQSTHLSWDMMGLWQRTMHLLTHIDNWSINYCKLSANMMADLLSKHDSPVVALHTTSLPPLLWAVYQEEQSKPAAFTATFYFSSAGNVASTSLTWRS